jgi:hypothetical protein
MKSSWAISLVSMKLQSDVLEIVSVSIMKVDDDGDRESPETLCCNFILTRVIAREDFIVNVELNIT